MPHLDVECQEKRASWLKFPDEATEPVQTSFCVKTLLTLINFTETEMLVKMHSLKRIRPIFHFTASYILYINVYVTNKILNLDLKRKKKTLSYTKY